MARAAAKSKKSGLGEDSRIVVLHGPDEMQKKAALQDLRAALTEAHGEVELFTFEGKAASLADVFDELRSYSLMQTYKIVLVDNAEEFTKTHRQALERYAENPVEHATLVLRAGTWHAGKLDKLIEKVGAVVKCTAMSPAAAKSWLIARAKDEYERKLSAPAAEALIDRLGTEGMKLDTELAKLSLMVQADQPIEPALVQQVVGRSSEEQAWAVQEAVLEAMGRGDGGRILSKVHELVDLGGQPEVLVTYFVADLIRKLNIAVMLRAAGMPDAAIAKELKLWGPRQAMFLQVLRKLRPGAPGRLFDEAMRADQRAKSGLGETMRNLECLCVRLADEMR